jgi:hypothetical protein
MQIEQHDHYRGSHARIEHEQARREEYEENGNGEVPARYVVPQLSQYVQLVA